MNPPPAALPADADADELAANGCIDTLPAVPMLLALVLVPLPEPHAGPRNGDDHEACPLSDTPVTPVKLAKGDATTPPNILAPIPLCPLFSRSAPPPNKAPKGNPGVLVAVGEEVEATAVGSIKLPAVACVLAGSAANGLNVVDKVLPDGRGEEVPANIPEFQIYSTCSRNFHASSFMLNHCHSQSDS